MEENSRIHAAFNEYIRPATFPVGVKVSTDPELPPNVKSATQLNGHAVNICQGVTMARRIGRTVGFTEKDHACGHALIIFGHKESPDFQKAGNTVYPLYTKTPEAGAITNSKVPLLPRDSAKSIILAPLHRADFTPDVVLVYGNAAQIVRMVQGALYNEGGSIETQFTGRCACASYIAHPLNTKKCNVVIPGGGERVFALTMDDELLFAMPYAKVNDVIEGLVATHKNGVARIPTPFFGIGAKPVFPKQYADLNAYCELD